MASAVRSDAVGRSGQATTRLCLRVNGCGPCDSSMKPGPEHLPLTRFLLLLGPSAPLPAPVPTPRPAPAESCRTSRPQPVERRRSRGRVRGSYLAKVDVEGFESPGVARLRRAGFASAAQQRRPASASAHVNRRHIAWPRRHQNRSAEAEKTSLRVGARRERSKWCSSRHRKARSLPHSLR